MQGPLGGGARLCVSVMPVHLVRPILPLLLFALLWLAAPAHAAISFVAASSASDNASTLAIANPSGASSNDVLVAFISNRGNATVSAPGWTMASGVVDGTNQRLTVLYRVRTAADAASYTFTLSAASRVTGSIVTFRDVDVSNPIVTDVTNTQGATTTLSIPGINVPLNEAALVAGFAQSHGNHTITVESGLSAAASSSTQAGPNGVTQAIGYVLQPVAGASGNKTARSTGSARAVSAMLVLRPAAFATSGLGPFNAYESSTAVNAVSGLLRTKIVGQPFTVDVITLSADRTAYGYYLSAMTKVISGIRVEILDASNNGGAMDASTSCRSSWTLAATLGTTYSMTSTDGGRKAFTMTAPVALRQASLRISWQSSPSAPVMMGCSNDLFAVRPAAFADLQARDADATSAGTTRLLDNTNATSGVVHRAGRPFTLQGRAVDASGATVPGYDGTPQISVNCVQPVGCAPGALTGTPAASSGVFSATMLYNEAGVIALSAEDSTFAQVDVNDPGSTLGERSITLPTAVSVGRFVPDSYSVTPNAPSFSAGCGTANATFVGQTFGFDVLPTALATPLNADGQALANARPRFTPGMVTVEVTATGAPTALQGTLGTVSVSQAATASISVGTSSFNFTRASTPSAPYTPAFTLRVRVADATESNGGTPLTLSGEGSTSVAFAGGHLMHYGRLDLRPAYGDARQDLVLPLGVQSFNGIAWVPLTAAASCIAISPAHFAYTGARGGLATGGAFNCASSVASVNATSGRWVVRLPRPSLASGVAEAAMNVQVNTLAAASGQVCTGGLPGAATSTLNSPWLAQPDGSNPAARVQWGRSRGDFLQLREVFN